MIQNHPRRLVTRCKHSSSLKNQSVVQRRTQGGVVRNEVDSQVKLWLLSRDAHPIHMVVCHWTSYSVSDTLGCIPHILLYSLLPSFLCPLVPFAFLDTYTDHIHTYHIHTLFCAYIEPRTHKKEKTSDFFFWYWFNSSNTIISSCILFHENHITILYD